MITTAAGSQRKRTERGRARRNLPRVAYERKARDTQLGREQFRVSALRGRGLPRVDIDNLVEEITWEDTTAVTTGTVRMRDYGKPIFFKAGHQVLLEVQTMPGGAWKELWRMRAWKPTQSYVDGSRTFELANDLALLQGSRDDFKYTKNRAHPRGWLVHQAIRDVARRYGLKIAALPRTRTRVKKLVMLNSSPYDVIVRLMKMERRETGRRYVLSMEKGKLAIRPLKRSQRLLMLGPLLIDASLNESMKETFATALTVRNTIRRGTQRDGTSRKRQTSRKISVKVSSRAGVRRFGFIHQIVNAPHADSAAEARAYGRRRLAKLMQPTKEITLSHPGIPGLKRGDALKLLLPDRALTRMIWVKSATWQLTQGDFSVSLTVAMDDPFKPVKANRTKAKRDAAARRRGRKQPHQSEQQQRNRDKKQPRRNRARKNKRPPSIGGRPTPVVE